MPSPEADETRREAIAALCRQLVLDPALPHLDEALTHPSFTNEQRDDDVRDNQRLEFLGDAVLGLCVSELLMEVFAEVDEGALTLMRAALVNARALASEARQLGMGEALRMGRGADAAGERRRTNVLADALEALVGAVYLDCGLDGARELCRRVLGPRIEELVSGGGMERDPKSRLQELVQARGLDAPRYELVAIDGPPHSRTFTARVEVPPAEIDESVPVRGEGQGRSKKLAEQEAARAALDALASRQR